MILRVKKDAYSGADGTSISAQRCDQMVLIYEMLEDIGDRKISYVELQDEAESNHIFEKAQARSAIRTIFPLLKKIGFVYYDGKFSANTCFTDLGKQFVLAHRAWQKTSNKFPYSDKIRERLEHIKQNLQKIGLIEMSNTPEYSTHKIWIAIRLLHSFQKLNWSEYIYALYLQNEGSTFDEIIAEIQANAKQIRQIEFQNENGNPLPDTCFTYVRSFLVECNLISNEDSNVSKVTQGFDYFYSKLMI